MYVQSGKIIKLYVGFMQKKEKSNGLLSEYKCVIMIVKRRERYASIAWDTVVLPLASWSPI